MNETIITPAFMVTLKQERQMKNWLHNSQCDISCAEVACARRTHPSYDHRHRGEILLIWLQTWNSVWLADVPIFFKNLSCSSELSWAMFQKNLGLFMVLSGNHVRLGSSTWCTPQTRQKLAVSTKFHFDFGHNKATGFSCATLHSTTKSTEGQPQSKMLVPQKPIFKECQTWSLLQCKVWTFHGVLSKSHFLKSSTWIKPSTSKDLTLCFVFPTSHLVTLFQMVSCYWLISLPIMHVHKQSICCCLLFKTAWVKLYLLELKLSISFSYLVL